MCHKVGAGLVCSSGVAGHGPQSQCKVSTHQRFFKKKLREGANCGTFKSQRRVSTHQGFFIRERIGALKKKLGGLPAPLSITTCTGNDYL